MRAVIMKTISAGPDGVFRPGDRRELKDLDAAFFVRNGYAEYHGIRPEAVKGIVPEEVSVIAPEEKAVLRRGRPKK